MLNMKIKSLWNRGDKLWHTDCWFPLRWSITATAAIRVWLSLSHTVFPHFKRKSNLNENRTQLSLGDGGAERIWSLICRKLSRTSYWGHPASTGAPVSAVKLPMLSGLCGKGLIPAGAQQRPSPHTWTVFDQNVLPSRFQLQLGNM